MLHLKKKNCMQSRLHNLPFFLSQTFGYFKISQNHDLVYLRTSGFVREYVFDHLCHNCMLCSSHIPFPHAIQSSIVKLVLLSMVESQRSFEKGVPGCNGAI